ncbi:MAG: hypothetical protein JOZ69_22550, partial [Myxococcales bacterium]|nr:hypothetical protein [Myxococcales bacterium]
MNPRRELRRTARIAGFACLTSAMLPAYLARSRLTAETRRGPLRERWVGAWAGALLRLFGVQVISKLVVPGA